MSLIKDDLYRGTVDIVELAILRLKEFEPEEGYYLAFSGGKDSVVIKKLTEMSGVKFDAHYNLTTIDPPELVQFIRKEHPDVVIERPEVPFLIEMVKRGFPMRQRRWCCEVFKERGGTGRLVVTGIRAAESAKRSKRKMVESCYKDTSKRYLNVIIEWTDADVWEFIKSYGVPYSSLYDEGFKRLGCILCPYARDEARRMEIERWPKYVAAFERAFVKLYVKKKAEGKTSVDRWNSGEEMFKWWLTGEGGTDPDQTVMFE